jgi:hypothetical protein
MRKTAAYLLLTCFGVYHLGFFAVQFLMPIAIHHHWEKQVWDDQNPFLSGKLVRVPFSMPYGQDQEHFQAVNFSMEIEGKTKRVIKQRYFDDHLEVVVVEDQLQTKFDEQVELWLFSIGVDQGDIEGSPLQNVLLKSFVKNFVLNSTDWRASVAFSEISVNHSSPFLLIVPKGTKDVIPLPPEQIHFS